MDSNPCPLASEETALLYVPHQRCDLFLTPQYLFQAAPPLYTQPDLSLVIIKEIKGSLKVAELIGTKENSLQKIQDNFFNKEAATASSLFCQTLTMLLPTLNFSLVLSDTFGKRHLRLRKSAPLKDQYHKTICLHLLQSFLKRLDVTNEGSPETLFAHYSNIIIIR